MLLRLQGQRGNRYVQQVVRSAAQTVLAAPGRSAVQPKLLVGPAGDRYEQEADRMARQVIGRGPRKAPGFASVVDRRGAAGVAGANASHPRAHSAVERAHPAGQRLPSRLRESMEQRFGADFSGVRTHRDAQADQLNRALGARAFTSGQDIFFRRGNYDPASHSGRQVLAHELTHVLQQNHGLSSQPRTLRAPPGKIQRFLFSSYTIPRSVEAFKQDVGPDRHLIYVLHRLDNYVAQHPRDPSGAPIKLSQMSLDQLGSTRRLLLDLQDTIDSTLREWGPLMAPEAADGAERLRILVQNELGQVVARQGIGGEFPQRVGPEVSPLVRRTDLASFTDWLTAHPVYRRWEYQGAGACADAARDILKMLRRELFIGAALAGEVKARGIRVLPPRPLTSSANHFVVVARIGTQNVVIDPTMGQFLGGHPIVEPEPTWKERFHRSKVAFGFTYVKPAKVEWKDFRSINAAVRYAPQRIGE